LVAHGVDTGNGCGHGVRIADVGPMNVDAVAPCARRVEDPDAIAGGDERVDDVRPDEPCPAGDENVHLSGPGWEGEGDGEPAAAVLVAHGDVTPVRLDEATGDGEPEAGAGVARRSRGVAAERDVEDASEVALGDAAPGVADRHVRAAVVATGHDRDGAVAR